MCGLEPDWIIGRHVYLTGLSQFHDSSDCGFFAGMALKLLSEGAGNPEIRQSSRREVYDARDDFLQREHTGRHEHIRSLEPDEGVFYLRDIGLSMVYHYRPLGSVRNIWQQMHIYMSPWRGQGIMFTVQDGVQGHWASIVGIGERDRQTAFRIYDSSGIPGTPERSMDWCTVTQAARAYPHVPGLVTAVREFRLPPLAEGSDRS